MGDGALAPVLASVARAVERTRWAAELADPQWRLVWLSSELKRLLGDPPHEVLHYGEHVLELRRSEPLQSRVTPAARVEWLRINLPRIAAWTPGGLDALRPLVGEALLAQVEPLEVAERAPIWSGETAYVHAQLPPAMATFVTCALWGPGAEPAGWLTLYKPATPASLLSLIARGDPEHMARMAELLEPARREAAILFADIQASGELARRMSSAAWFNLIREFSTDADAAVIAAGGIVGRHAGDGVVAFFLADQLGSRRAACGAALRAGLAVVGWRPGADLPVRADEIRINAGAHWGGAIYLGQVITGGRLEVTALGDEVNECARIQQTARGGTLLVAKPLVERLDPADAESLDLDPGATRYRPLAELPGVGAKAVRDAGSVPVVGLRP